MVMRDKDNKTIIHGGISDMFFREQNNDITSFFKLSINENFSSVLVPEIILGPKCKLENYDFGTYLSLNKLNSTKIKRSISPLK